MKIQAINSCYNIHSTKKLPINKNIGRTNSYCSEYGNFYHYFPINFCSNFDSKKFSEEFGQKIIEQMHIKTSKDFKDLVFDISQQTGADVSLVCEAMTRISQFASYSQLGMLEKEMCSNGISRAYMINEFCNTNSVIDYLHSSKGQMDLKYKGKPAFFVDFPTLEYLEKIKRENPQKFSNFIMRTFDYNFVAIDGANLKLGGKNHSYTMFGRTDDLKNLTQGVVNKVMMNKMPLEEALNGDLSYKFNEIFDGRINLSFLKNYNELEDPYEQIAKNNNPIAPNRVQIQSIVDVWSDSRFKTGLDKKNGPEIIAKYLDVMFFPLTSEIINDSLVKQYKTIEKIVASLGKTMDDVYYTIPTNGKSFELITKQYAIANDISMDKIIKFDGSNYGSFDYLKDKVVVLLDDFSGSGRTMCGQEFDYEEFCSSKKFKNTNLIFAPIVTLEGGYEYIESKIKEFKRVAIDTIANDNIINFKRDFYSKLTKKEKDLSYRALGSLGYTEGGSFITLPYMIPDNNSDVAIIFSSFFMNKPKSIYITDKIFNWSELEGTYKKILHKIEKKTKEIENSSV